MQLLIVGSSSSLWQRLRNKPGGTRRPVPAAPTDNKKSSQNVHTDVNKEVNG